MGPTRAAPCSAPAGIDTMPMKVDIPTASPLWRSVGWDTSSCDAADERGSEAGSSSQPPAEPVPMPLSQHTPLRSQAAPFRPAWAQQPACDQAAPSKQQARPKKSKVPAQEAPTTVMMCNLPFDLTSDTLIGVMDSMGFSGQFDFVYVPMNVAQFRSVGYGFVNLTSHAAAKLFTATFQGFMGWASEYPFEACHLRWSCCDGLDANIKRNQNSPIMADSVPAVCKPMLLKNGTKIPFPRPSKKLRPMRNRKGMTQDNSE